MTEAVFASILCVRTMVILRKFKRAHPGTDPLSPYLTKSSVARLVSAVILLLVGIFNFLTQHYVPSTPLPAGLPDVVYLSGIFTLLALLWWPGKEIYLAYQTLKFMFSATDEPLRPKAG
jgi:hypothetical protein